MTNKLETLKLNTNIPELLEFKYNEFKSGQGQYGTWHMTTVVHRGVDKTFFPTEFLYGKLMELGNLQGKTFQITKIEDGEYKSWKICDERGAEITPSAPQSPTSHASTVKQQSTNPQLNESLEAKIRVSFEKRDKAIEELATMVIELQEKVARLEQMQIPIVKPKLTPQDKSMMSALGIEE